MQVAKGRRISHSVGMKNRSNVAAYQKGTPELGQNARDQRLKKRRELVAKVAGTIHPA